MSLSQQLRAKRFPAGSACGTTCACVLSHFMLLLLRFAAGLRALMSLSKQLRAKRFEAGALSLASPEVKFKIDTETHNPLDVGMYQVGLELVVIPAHTAHFKTKMHNASRQS
jgi:hypothetical protein